MIFLLKFFFNLYVQLKFERKEEEEKNIKVEQRNKKWRERERGEKKDCVFFWFNFPLHTKKLILKRMEITSFFFMRLAWIYLLEQIAIHIASLFFPLIYFFKFITLRERRRRRRKRKSDTTNLVNLHFCFYFSNFQFQTGLEIFVFVLILIFNKNKKSSSFKRLR